MLRHQVHVLLIYLVGFALVFAQAAAAAVLVMWGLQTLALAFDEAHAWDAVVRHLFLTFSLLAFFPGQKFWTVRMRGWDGQDYVIVGGD